MVEELMGGSGNAEMLKCWNAEMRQKDHETAGLQTTDDETKGAKAERGLA
jgi:hypothetical protein